MHPLHHDGTFTQNMSPIKRLGGELGNRGVNLGKTPKPFSVDQPFLPGRILGAGLSTVYVRLLRGPSVTPLGKRQRSAEPAVLDACLGQYDVAAVLKFMPRPAVLQGFLSHAHRASRR